MGSPTFKTFKRLIREGQANEVSDERLLRLIECGLWDVVVDHPNYVELLNYLDGMRIKGEYALTISPSDTFERLIRAGNYDWIWDDVTAQNFPVRKSDAGERQVVILHFGRKIDSHEAIRKAESQGFECPTHEDVLRFGAQYPEAHRQHRPVFLHEPFRIYCEMGRVEKAYVSYLYSSMGRRGISDLPLGMVKSYSANFAFIRPTKAA